MTYSLLYLKFLKILESGLNTTFVPFLLDDSIIGSSLLISPYSKETFFNFPSLTDCTSKREDKAFTALVPTPFNPTDFLNALVSYLPPVFILETTSVTFPKGMPLP